MAFEKDIFISYAHIDDEPLVEGGRGWVSEFHRSLEVRLAQLLGYKPHIWRDTDLDGNHVFSEEIISQFPQIAIMVSVISPRYVKSDWCVKEVHEFISASQKNIGLTVQNRSRIFKAIKTPVSLDQHPVPIREVLGYEFFRLDPERKKVSEFNHVFGKEAQVDYWTRLNDIAHDIAELLEEIRGSGNTAASAPARNLGSIYLGETTYELSENRESLRRELMAMGYEVLPDRNLPLETEAYRNEALRMLRESKIILLPVGNRYGIVPEGGEKSVTQIQFEASAEWSREQNIPRLVWLAGNTPEDHRQENFLRMIRSDEQMSGHTDLIEASFNDFKQAVKDTLEKINRPAAAAGSTAASGEETSAPPRIYLLSDQQDAGQTAELEDYFFAQGCDVITPLFDGDQAQLRSDHQENLVLCDAVVIYYGSGSELWLRAMMRDLLKAPGYGRQAPIRHKAVYLAPPAGPGKDRFRTHEATVINGSGGLNRAALDQFTATLRKA